MEPDHAQLMFIRQSRMSREIFQVNSIRVGRPIMQALKLFVTASDVAVSQEKTQKMKIKSLSGLFIAVAF